MIYVDNKETVKRLALIERIKNNEPISLNVFLLNVIPYLTTKGASVIENLNELFVFDRTDNMVKGIPNINGSKFIAIRKLLEVQMINEINRKFYGRYGDADITELKDIDEVHKAAEENVELAEFLESINFKNKLDIDEEAIKEIIEKYEDDDMGIKAIVYPNIIKAISVPKDMIPVNKELEAGKMFKLYEKLTLYKVLEENECFQFDHDYEIIIFSEDNEYIVNKSIYGYPVIRKIDLNVYFKSEIWVPFK